MNTLLEAEVVSQGLVFRNAPPLWVIFLVIIPGIIAFTAFFYRLGREASPATRWLLTAIRTLVLVLLALLLMDPALETLVVERKPTLTVVLTDVSASMDHRDDYATSPDLGTQMRNAATLPPGTPLDTTSRLDFVKRILDDEADSFLAKLSKNFRIRLYSFGEKLQSVPDIKNLEARDRFTAFGRSIERILEEPEVKSSPIGSIVVITDGKNTSGPSIEEVADAASRRKIPIHTVSVGDPAALKDIELVSVMAPAVALLEDRITIEAKLRHRGFPGQRVEIRLLEGTNVLARQMDTLLPTEEDQELRLFYTPVRQGQQQWTVEVRPVPGEHTAENNRRSLEILIKNSRLKVLYVESYPRYEYRKLMSFLTRSGEAFQCHCFLLDADRGFPQERSPDLESLLRLPETEEELFYYDVVIFGDVDPDRLGDEDPERARGFMQLIKKFVEGGGGFALIAGERFAPRAYKDTAIGEILPIIIDPTEISGPTSDGGSSHGFKMRLTEIGKTHPTLQVADDPETNQRRFEQRDEELALREMFWFGRVKKAKPGAMVLAVHETERNLHGNYPLVVTGTYGEGPVFFSAVDETWRWYWWQGPFSHHRYWGNVVRHLARTRLLSGDKRFRLLANRSEYQVGDQITLTAWAKDKTFRPSDKDEQEVILKKPGKPEQRELLRRIEPGKFERSFAANETGEYQAWLPPEDGLSDEKISPISFRVLISDVERKEPAVDETALKLLASKTGGRHLRLPDIKSLLEEVSKGTVEIPRQRRFLHLRDEQSPFLHWLPLAFLSLLTLEWIIRKRSRLL